MRLVLSTTCGYYLSFVWRPPFYSLDVAAYKNKGICLEQSVFNLSVFELSLFRPCFTFPIPQPDCGLINQLPLQRKPHFSS